MKNSKALWSHLSQLTPPPPSRRPGHVCVWRDEPFLTLWHTLPPRVCSTQPAQGMVWMWPMRQQVQLPWAALIGLGWRAGGKGPG